MTTPTISAEAERNRVMAAGQAVAEGFVAMAESMLHAEPLASDPRRGAILTAGLVAFTADSGVALGLDPVEFGMMITQRMQFNIETQKAAAPRILPG